MLMKSKQAKQDDARRVALLHALLGRIHPGNQAEVFIWQKFPARLSKSRLEKPRSREPSQRDLSYEHIEIFTKELEVKRDLGNRASPANRAHMKRPSVNSKRDNLHSGHLLGICQVVGPESRVHLWLAKVSEHKVNLFLYYAIFL